MLKQMGIKCILCDERVDKYKIVEITKGECAALFNIDIGNSKSRDYRMHPECADVFLVTKRISNLKIKAHEG